MQIRILAQDKKGNIIFKGTLEADAVPKVGEFVETPFKLIEMPADDLSAGTDWRVNDVQWRVYSDPVKGTQSLKPELLLASNLDFEAEAGVKSANETFGNFLNKADPES